MELELEEVDRGHAGYRGAYLHPPGDEKMASSNVWQDREIKFDAPVQ